MEYSIIILMEFLFYCLVIAHWVAQSSRAAGHAGFLLHDLYSGNQLYVQLSLHRVGDISSLLVSQSLEIH